MDYLNILGDHVYPMVQTLFPYSDGIFQDHNSPMHTDNVVKNLCEQQERELEHMEWPSQSP